MQAPLPCRGDTRVVCADIGYRHSSATLARLSSRCRTAPPKLVVITPLPMAGGAAGTLPYAYAYASVSLCRCHALSAAQAVHSCHISGREVFSSVNFTSLSIRRCWRIVGSRQPHATPTPELSSAASGIGAAVGITSQFDVPAAPLRGASRQSARHTTWRCEPIAHIPTPHIAAASLAIPLSAMTKARRTANTCHCAAGLRRGSGWLLESAACHGATLHCTSFRYGLRYG